MSEHASHDEHVPHEAAHDAAIDDQLRRTSAHAAIADLLPLAPEDLVAIDTVPLSVPSAAYVEAEAVATQEAVNDILTAVTDIQTAVNALLAGYSDMYQRVNDVLEVLRDAELIPTELV